MAPARPDSPLAIGARLRLIRLAYGVVQGRSREMSQAEFARLCGINPAAWNNAETGDNRIGIDSAKAIKRRTRVGLNYIFDGDLDDLPHSLAVEIQKLAAAKPTRRA